MAMSAAGPPQGAMAPSGGSVVREATSVGATLSASSTGALTWNPVARVQARFRQWWQARLPLRDSITLTQRNVYILPTRPGFMMGITLLVLLIASINFQLNLGYVLTFLLTGSAVVGMHVCHGTLRGITMNLVAPEPQFAGASVTIGVNLLSQRRSPRYGSTGAGLMFPPKAVPRCRWLSSHLGAACTRCRR
jgi:hypothetical protein